MCELFLLINLHINKFKFLNEISMKKTTFLLALIIILGCTFNLNHVNAQSPSWIWAHNAGSVGYDYAYSVVVDSSGNSYVAGDFGGTIQFDMTHSFTSVGSGDLYIVKYDPAGKVVWAKSQGGTGGESASSVAVDKSGNVYVVGYFKSPTIVFGTTTLTLAGGNIYDLFIAKYDVNGNILWAKSAGGTGDDRATGITIDNSGNCLITGWFVSSSLTLGAFTLTNTGSSDIFVAKYAPDGTALWAKSASGSSWDYSYGIAVDQAGNSFIAGKFNGSTLTLGSIILTKVTNNDLFVAKYAPDGTVIWAKRAGNYTNNSANAVATDKGGNCYVSGIYGGASIVFGTYTLTSGGGIGDMFVVKYNPAGTVMWAKSAGGTLEDGGTAVKTDKAGYCYAGGYFKSDSIKFETTTLKNTKSTTSDIFITEYDTSGNVIWAKSAGGTGDDVPSSVAVDTLRNFFLTGYIGSPTVVFGTTTLTCGGSTDMFITKSDNISGVHELNRDFEFTVFPNPASDFISVKLDQKADIEILNLQGQVCKKANNYHSGSRLDISDFPQGIYLVKVTAAGGFHTEKIIKE